MSAILIALFVLGVAMGLILRAFKLQQPQGKNRQSSNTKLDTVDEMFLYGEATNDEFYKM